ncbi:MAG: hypothetical protein ACRDHF_01800 [Tepidiformaceae bacterium]
MVTNILRRGGAWRIAALLLLAASIMSFGLTGSDGVDSASAHQGQPGTYCGTANIPPILQYAGQLDVLYPDGWADHFHKWTPAGTTDIYLAYCYSYQYQYV